MILWAGSTTGPRVSPGKYTVRLTVDGKTQTQSFEVKKDPRLDTTPEDYAQQLSLSLQVRDKLSDTNDAVIRIRELRKQLDDYAKRDSKKVADAAKALNQKLTEVEEALYQTKNRASEDPLNYPDQAEQQAGARPGRGAEFRRPADAAIVHGLRRPGDAGECRVEETGRADGRRPGRVQ